jgi:predicted cobalt transporter CbtA
MNELSFGGVLNRGLIAGAAAGLAAALVGLLVVEPQIKLALAVEESRGGADTGHEEMFNRGTQIVGGMVAAVAIGLCLGVVLAVVFARLRHRLPGATDFGRAAWLSAAGFATVALLPAVKYPANPPGVGDPATVDERTIGYFALIAAGVAAAYLALLTREWFTARGWPPAYRAAVVTAGVVVTAALLLLLLPGTPDSVPSDIGADLLWRFRLASVAELAALWTVLGLTFGLLLTPRRARTAVAA